MRQMHQFFQGSPSSNRSNAITPRWVFRRNFENGALIEHKAQYVARRVTQVSSVDLHEAYLYTLVVRLETFLTALLNLALRQFDVSAATLPDNIDEGCLGETSCYTLCLVFNEYAIFEISTRGWSIQSIGRGTSLEALSHFMLLISASMAAVQSSASVALDVVSRSGVDGVGTDAGSKVLNAPSDDV